MRTFLLHMQEPEQQDPGFDSGEMDLMKLMDERCGYCRTCCHRNVHDTFIQETFKEHFGVLGKSRRPGL